MEKGDSTKRRMSVEFPTLNWDHFPKSLFNLCHSPSCSSIENNVNKFWAWKGAYYMITCFYHTVGNSMAVGSWSLTDWGSNPRSVIYLKQMPQSVQPLVFQSIIKDNNNIQFWGVVRSKWGNFCKAPRTVSDTEWVLSQCYSSSLLLIYSLSLSYWRKETIML